MQNEELIVIGAGLPRTGTRSLSVALQEVLKGPCFHGSRLPSFSKSDIQFWIKIIEGHRPSSAEWREYLKDEKAAMDYPIVLFYQDLMRAFPNAKVVATVRDPDSWYDSWWSSIGKTLEAIDTQPIKWVLRTIEDKRIRKIHETARRLIPRGCSMSLDDAFKSKESSRKFYEEWMAEVQRSVPKDQLLLFEIQQGWEPLCKFLSIPVPNSAFPRVNESAEIQDSIRRMKIIAWAITIGIPVTITAVCFIAWKKFK